VRSDSKHQMVLGFETVGMIRYNVVISYVFVLMLSIIFHFVWFVMTYVIAIHAILFSMQKHGYYILPISCIFDKLLVAWGPEHLCKVWFYVV